MLPTYLKRTTIASDFKVSKHNVLLVEVSLNFSWAEVRFLCKESAEVVALTREEFAVREPLIHRILIKMAKVARLEI